MLKLFIFDDKSFVLLIIYHKRCKKHTHTHNSIAAQESQITSHAGLSNRLGSSLILYSNILKIVYYHGIGVVCCIMTNFHILIFHPHESHLLDRLLRRKN